MDKLGAKDKKQTTSRLDYKSHSTFFRSPTKKRDFVIHPEWVSEGVSSSRRNKDVPDSGTSSFRKMNSMKDRTATFPPRRTRTPDPITWRDWPTKDTSRPVLKTQKVDLNQSFDKVGNSSSDSKHRRNIFEGTFFSSARSPKKPYYTIHPEWVSESFSVKGLSIQGKKDYRHTIPLDLPQRRCKSAPPPRSRNPITWENW